MQAFLKNIALIAAIFMVALSTMNIAQANKIQLAYLQIEEVTENLNDKKITENTTKSAKGKYTHYKVMWKQPSNTNNEPLDLMFSDGVVISPQSAPLSLNGANIQHVNLRAINGLAGKTLTVINLEKTTVEVMLKFTGNNSDYAVRITPSSPSYTFTKSPSTLQTIKSYTVFGVEHILEGYDHLLFVLCLLL